MRSREKILWSVKANYVSGSVGLSVALVLICAHTGGGTNLDGPNLFHVRDKRRRSFAHDWLMELQPKLVVSTVISILVFPTVEGKRFGIFGDLFYWQFLFLCSWAIFQKIAHVREIWSTRKHSSLKISQLRKPSRWKCSYRNHLSTYDGIADETCKASSSLFVEQIPLSVDLSSSVEFSTRLLMHTGLHECSNLKKWLDFGRSAKRGSNTCPTWTIWRRFTQICPTMRSEWERTAK